ncbi:MAG TPA: hypothetical protein VG454_11445 [Gemmatimonadales bacterium]|nr:hypothetical protein [Gemmatimonadales bacterium]
MTLGRIVVAWILAGAWFEIATFVTTYIVNRLAVPPGATVYVDVPLHVIKRRASEAALITLIASLWFDSLGSGEWWLLFLLFGLLISSLKWFTPAPDAVARRVVLAEIVCDVARYVGAGALLAWRLS